MVREPAVAGAFYPAGETALRSMIESFSPPVEGKVSALGALLPHAGYVFSGPVAAQTVARMRVPGTVLLLSPSHRFTEPACALWTGGAWKTPLGEVGLHQGLTSALADLPMVSPADRVHLPEHSGEVVLPFLQFHNPEVRIAAICVTTWAGLEELKALGEAIPGMLAESGAPDALVVASSDMSHESGPDALSVVNCNDPLAIERMEQLDPEGLHRVCRERRITMCGVLPATAMLASAVARGATEGTLVARATSADSPAGQSSYVVGYAGMTFR